VEFTESETAGTYQSNPETVRLIETLERQNQRIVNLMAKSDKLDKNIKLSQDFIQIQIKKEIQESRQDMQADADMTGGYF
jgi:uncharacterized protein YdcH (DUF465 family)